MTARTPDALPLKNDINTAWMLSAGMVILMGIMSLAGLVFPNSLYPTETLIQTYMTNDVINLLVGVPILVGSMWLTRRGSLVGLLFWPGALVYLIYNYTSYLIGIPIGASTLLFLVLILVSCYIVYDLLQRIDGAAVKTKLAGEVPETLAGWFLVIIGILFIGRAASVVFGTSADQAALPSTEIGVLLADVIVSIFWIIGGFFLVRRKPLGYTSSLGLLFAASTLFLGLIIFLIIQPLLISAPLSLIDIGVVAVMGAVLSIPFALFLRGTISASKT